MHPVLTIDYVAYGIFTLLLPTKLKIFVYFQHQAVI
jgi:hypothetical protein